MTITLTIRLRRSEDLERDENPTREEVFEELTLALLDEEFAGMEVTGTTLKLGV